MKVRVGQRGDWQQLEHLSKKKKKVCKDSAHKKQAQAQRRHNPQEAGVSADVVFEEGRSKGEGE